MWFGSSKAAALTEQNKKPAKLVWTQSWRIRNKKGLSDIVGKKKTRRTRKVARAMVGVSLDELKRRQTQSGAVRAKAQADSLKKLKEKKADTKKAAAKKSKSKAPSHFNKLPKNVKTMKK